MENIRRTFTHEELSFVKECSESINQNGNGNNTSNNTNVLEHPSMAGIKTFVQGHLNAYAKALYGAGDKFDFYVTQSWFNYANPGEYHMCHCHSNSLISGVLYINAVTGRDKVVFFPPQGIKDMVMFSPDDSEQTEYNAEFFNAKVNTGDLLMFKSSLYHAVDRVPGDSGATRISLAFNSFVSGSLGGDKYLNHLKLPR